jgi:hypothetical protein
MMVPTRDAEAAVDDQLDLHRQSIPDHRAIR